MSHYRLLRDNKETGPFSEEEMIAKGFKPYDLIWVEGKSAGWRYPSEIPAFKNFAPVVEEQPYDRFYKKQAPQKLFTGDERINYSAYNPTSVATKMEPVQAQAPVFAAAAGGTGIAKKADPLQVQQPVFASPAPEYAIKSLPGKHIHVTLPSGNTINLNTLVSDADSRQQRDNILVNKTVSHNEPVKTVVAEIVFTPAQPVIKETVATVTVAEEDRFSNRVNNAMAAGRRQNKPGEPFASVVNGVREAIAGLSWSLVAACFIGIATLVGLGIMIGLSMNREKNDLAFNEALKNKSRQSQPVADNTSRPPVISNIPEPPATVADGSLSSNDKELVQNAVVKSNSIAYNEPKDTKKLPEENPAQEKSQPQEIKDEPLLHVKPVVPSPVNVEKNLSLSANEFKTGAFGGISGLKYTLHNGSKFPLESVEVEVNYVQANDKVYKTEKILFKDISAGSQATIEAPSSSRGVKITSRIIKVNAREAALSNTTAKS